MIRVCLVDDQTLVRQGIRSLLALDDGIEVVAEAGDGRQAAELIPQVRPDVVLMDMVLPGIDGIEAIRRIRAQGAPLSGVAIVGVSGRDSDEKAALTAGADAFILKPVSPRVLAQVLAKVLRGRSSL